MGLSRPAKIWISAIIIYLVVWFGGFLYLPSGCSYEWYVEIFDGIKLSDWFSIGLSLLILIIGIGGCLVYYINKNKKKIDTVKIKPLYRYLAIVATPALIIFVLVMGVLLGHSWSSYLNYLSYTVLVYSIVALIIGYLVYWCLKD